MGTKKTTLLSILTFMLFANVFAQEQFERLYRATGRDHLGLDIKQTSDKGYLILSNAIGEDGTELPNMNVTKLSPKGDLQWSKDYEYEENMLPAGALVLLPNDSFAFTSIELQPNLNKIITVADAGGEVVWSRAYGRPAISPPGSWGGSELLSLEDGGFAMLGEIYPDDDGNDIYFSRVDSLGELLWAHHFNGLDSNDGTEESIGDAKSTLDNGFILTGTLSDGSNNKALLIKLDTFGTIEWSRQYLFSSLFSPGQTANTVAVTADTNYIFGGTANIINASILSMGWVSKVDSSGNVIWAQILNDTTPSADINTRINKVLIADDGNVIATGRGFNISTASSFAFMMKLDAVTGEIIWQEQYNDITGLAVNTDGFIQTEDGGFAYFASGGDPAGGTNGRLPYLIKTNSEGESLCSNAASFQLLIPIMTADTLAFEAISTTDFLVKEPLIMPYDSFSLPVLSLEAPSFCEGEPILVTFDASINGGVSWLWSTGETTPMITVMEEGMYTVEVMIENDICFKLCDTTFISVIGPPDVEIVANTAPYCSDGFILLTADAQGANAFVWSSGETSQTIQVSALGDYAVTAINQCGSSDASVSITSFPTETFVSIDGNPSDFCESGAVNLVAIVGGAATFEWLPNGETTQAIVATAPGTYTVTATGEFCDPGMASIEIEGEPPVISAQVTLDALCSDGFAELQVTGSGFSSVEWSPNGETTTTINVSEAGTYTVTAFNDVCGSSQAEVVLTETPPTVNIEVVADSLCFGGTATYTFSGIGFNEFEWSTGDLTDTITLDQPTLFSITGISEFCGSTTDSLNKTCISMFDCVKVPNAFTPDNDDTNDSFTAYIPPECADIQVVELKVFSRWGELVFETQNPEERWDGMYKNKPAASDVYVWWMRLTNGEGEEDFISGDVTLLR